jgi:hypothetical protein
MGKITPKNLAAIKEALLSDIEGNGEVLLQLLLQEAKGGRKKIKRKFVPAGTLVIATKNGVVEQFPGKPSDELVLVEVMEEEAAPNPAIMTYLMDKILGRTAIAEGNSNTKTEIHFNMSPGHKTLGPESMTNSAVPTESVGNIADVIPADYKVTVTTDNSTEKSNEH